jgi:hypothetical protein
MPDDAAATRLDALRAILTSAHDLAARLATDPLLERLLSVFSRLPDPDRSVILGVLERDATWCRIVEQTADSTGITVRANPHASLFVHVFDHALPSTEPLRRDIDVIRFGIERFIHLVPLFFQDGVHEQWMASARELARDLDPELLAYTERLAREVLALVADAGADAPPQA